VVSECKRPEVEPIYDKFDGKVERIRLQARQWRGKRTKARNRRRKAMSKADDEGLDE